MEGIIRGKTIELLEALPVETPCLCTDGVDVKMIYDETLTSFAPSTSAISTFSNSPLATLTVNSNNASLDRSRL